MIMDAEMGEDEKSAALRNQGLVRQARYADRDRTTARAHLKHLKKARSSGNARQMMCYTGIGQLLESQPSLATKCPHVNN